MALQLAADDGPLEEIKLRLKRAIALWTNNIDALQELAYFYDAVVDDQDMQSGARSCHAQAVALITEMDEILLGRQTNQT